MTEIVNVEQAEAWNGAEGKHWAEHEEQFNAATRNYTRRLFEAVEIDSTDHVLDIGCGSGQTTREAARRAALGSAMGVDLSEPMLERARARAATEGLVNVTFARGDAQVYPFEAKTFDRAISRFGVMFFADPVAAFRNIGSALRPEGQVGFVVWQSLADNEWITAIRDTLAMGRELPVPPPDAPGPFAFADPARVREVFTAAGFRNVSIDPIVEPLHLGANADAAFAFASSMCPVQGLLAELDADERARALASLRASIEAHATPDGVRFGGGSWLVTAQR